MPVSEKKRASNARWDAKNLKRLGLAMRMTDYERMKAHVDVTGEPQNKFINRAIVETLDKEAPIDESVQE